MIGGICKELITIFIGIYFFHDSINIINQIGFCIVFIGIIFYKVMFHLGHDKDEESKDTIKNIVGSNDDDMRQLISSQDDTEEIRFEHIELVEDRKKSTTNKRHRIGSRSSSEGYDDDPSDDEIVHA